MHGGPFPKTTHRGRIQVREAGGLILSPSTGLPRGLAENGPPGKGAESKNVSLSSFRMEGLSQKVREVLLTHFGISGPIAMDMSREIEEASARGEACLLLDLKPALTMEVLAARIGRDFEKYSGCMFKDSLKDLLPRGLIPVLVDKSSAPPEKPARYVSKGEGRARFDYEGAAPYPSRASRVRLVHCNGRRCRSEGDGSPDNGVETGQQHLFRG